MAIEIWQADPTCSKITFKLRHLVFAAIEGQARVWRATIRIDPEHPSESSVEAAIDASSLDTGLPERDDHIRSAEFLGVSVHPEIRFTSTRVVRSGDTGYLLTGALTLGGQTREASIEVQDLGRRMGVDGVLRASFQGHATFNRQHFGLHWNQDLDTGGVVLGDKVEVTIALQAVQVVSTEVGVTGHPTAGAIR